MHRIVIGAVLAAAVAVPAHAAGKLGFEYTLEQERDGTIRDTSFLAGFEIRAGLRLKVKLDQPSYCYLIARGDDGRFRLTFPSTPAPAGRIESAKIPATTFVRMSDEQDIERLYLVVASERVPELESALAGETDLTEGTALAVRDRYQGPGRYTRSLNGGVTVSWKPSGDRPAVVVEEITLHRR